MPARKPKRNALFGRKSTRQTTPASARSFFSLTGESGYRKPSSSSGGKSGSSYKGFRVYQKGDGWTTSLDTDSIFESKAEAQRFLRSWKRNPSEEALIERASHFLSLADGDGDRSRVLRRVADWQAIAREEHMHGLSRMLNKWLKDHRVSGDEMAQYRNPDLIDQGAEAGIKAYETAADIPGLIRSGLGVKDRIKQMLMGTGRKRNSASGAEKLYESFHGKASEETMVVEEKFHEHEHLAPLGVAVNARVQTKTKGLVEIRWDDEGTFDETIADPKSIYLCSAEDGKQLYFVGGDQTLDLEKLGMDGDWVRDDMVIGVLEEITYRTRKKFDKFKLVEYFHNLGEETGDLPLLRYEPRSAHLFVSGGRYKIEMPWVGMSPGIEN